jgi:3-hydroxyisobutyrate dehydrogenase
VAVLGLGNMGGPMAANLVKAGHRVLGFDLAPATCAAAEAAGVAIAETAAAAVGDADVVVTMLPSGAHVLGVWSDVLLVAKSDTLFIDCSTIDVASARQAHALAAEHGCLALDAPVSGGVAGAEAGTLTFMVGGAGQAFATAEPLLAAMGKAVIHAGGPGNGQAAKICNNLILGVSMIAVCEAFALAERLGLPAQTLFDISSKSSGQCWSLTSYCPVPGPVPASPANRGYRPGFAAAMMLKDLRLAQTAAESVAARIPLGQQAEALYAEFVGGGGGGVDFSGIISMLQRQAPRIC